MLAISASKDTGIIIRPEDIFLDVVAMERDAVGMDQEPSEMIERWEIHGIRKTRAARDFPSFAQFTCCVAFFKPCNAVEIKVQRWV